MNQFYLIHPFGVKKKLEVVTVYSKDELDDYDLASTMPFKSYDEACKFGSLLAANKNLDFHFR